MQFWGDMIVKYPELISDLPQDIIVLLWGYEKDHPYDEQCNNLASSNIPFYVCPGTSSWGSLAGRTDNAIHNLLNSAEAGIEYGAIGYLNTDWGDCGHWQVLPISYLGFVAGAAYSWSLAANRDLDIKKATSWHAFRDLSGSMGQVSYDLGNIYKEIGFEPFSSSALFWILIWPHVKSDAFPEYSKANFENVEERVNRALEPLANASMERPDADLIKEEFLWTALIMRHACKRGELLKKAKEREDLEQVMQDLDYEMERIITDFTSIWLCRNRPGGLKESVKRLEMARELYKNENQPSSLGNYYLSSRIKKMIL